MKKTSAKKWSRDYVGAWGGVVAARPIPENLTPIHAIEGIGEPSYSAADVADAATGITRSIDAWAVVDDEWRQSVVDGVINMDRRDVLIGWALRYTRVSRWAGEGVTTEWYFEPGKAPPSAGGFLDRRWGDSCEERNQSAAIDFGRIRELPPH